MCGPQMSSSPTIANRSMSDLTVIASGDAVLLTTPKVFVASAEMVKPMATAKTNQTRGLLMDGGARVNAGEWSNVLPRTEQRSCHAGNRRTAFEFTTRTWQLSQSETAGRVLFAPL